MCRPVDESVTSPGTVAAHNTVHSETVNVDWHFLKNGKFLAPINQRRETKSCGVLINEIVSGLFDGEVARALVRVLAACARHAACNPLRYGHVLIWAKINIGLPDCHLISVMVSGGENEERVPLSTRSLSFGKGRGCGFAFLILLVSSGILT